MRCESALLSLTTTATFSADCPWTTGAAASQTVRQATAPTSARRMTKTFGGLLIAAALRNYSRGRMGRTGGRAGQAGRAGRNASLSIRRLRDRSCRPPDRRWPHATGSQLDRARVVRPARRALQPRHGCRAGVQSSQGYPGQCPSGRETNRSFREGQRLASRVVAYCQGEGKVVQDDDIGRLHFSGSAVTASVTSSNCSRARTFRPNGAHSGSPTTTVCQLSVGTAR